MQAEVQAAQTRGAQTCWSHEPLTIITIIQATKEIVYIYLYVLQLKFKTEFLIVLSY